MSQRELPILAEGDLTTGHRWVLRAGGTHADFGSFLGTFYPDGRHDSGGMAGPLLHPGSLMNTYTGGTGRGLRRVLARTDPRATRVHLHFASDEHLELTPVATMSDPALTFFAVLLPQEIELVSITALDTDGREIQADDLSTHQEHWRRFLAQLPPEC